MEKQPRYNPYFSIEFGGKNCLHEHQNYDGNGRRLFKSFIVQMGPIAYAKMAMIRNVHACMFKGRGLVYA